MADDLVNEAIKTHGAVPEGYKEIEVEFFRFKNPGDFIAGRLIKVGTQKMSGSIIGKYTISQETTNKKMAFLGSVQLDEKMSDVKVGDEIRVQYTHEESGGGGRSGMKNFKLFIKEKS